MGEGLFQLIQSAFSHADRGGGVRERVSGSRIRGPFCGHTLGQLEGFGRVPAIEILVDTPRIKELLLEGNTKAIAQAVYEGREHYGTQTFNQAIHALYKEGKVSFEDALANADNPDELKLEIRGITKGGKGGGGFFQ